MTDIERLRQVAVDIVEQTTDEDLLVLILLLLTQESRKQTKY